jgi:hemerythrin superfamily protein
MSTAEQHDAKSLLTLVERDHREIEQMLELISMTANGARRATFEDLVRKLAVHETAEEEVVHPLARRIGAEEVASSVMDEESTAKHALAELDGVDVDSNTFDQRFAALKHDVLAHAQREERDEHPLISANTTGDQLERLGMIFSAAEAVAPTHPHPDVPAGANLVLGPIFAITDRVRDTIRDARRAG